MNRQSHLPDAMQARSGITMMCVVALLLAAGCRHYHTREFVAVPRPVTFENWRLYVNVRVPVPDPSPTNDFYANLRINFLRRRMMTAAALILRILE